MKQPIIITPQFLQELEEKLIKSDFYQEKLAESKANFKRNSAYLKKRFPKMKFEE